MKPCNRFLPAALFVLTGVFLAGLIAVNPGHYTSVDSGYYLQSAGHLLAGRGYRVVEAGRLVWNGTFPVGYSALIALFSYLFGLPELLSSKLVNYAAVGVSGYVWFGRADLVHRNRPTWFLSVWGLGGFLRLMAYTWSETLFLVGLAEWVWQLHAFLRTPTAHRTVRLYLLSFALFLIRYVGGYAFGLTALLAFTQWLFPNRFQRLLALPRQPSIARLLLLCTFAGLLSMGLYFGLNSRYSASPFGGERFKPTESGLDLAVLFGRAILNEGLLIRDYLPNEPTGLVWLGGAIQLFLLGGLGLRFYRRPITPAGLPPLDSLSRLFLLTGLAYVVVLFAIRVVSPFSGPNARLMAPFTFCVLTAGLGWVSTLARPWQRIIRRYWTVLLLCSSLQLLPQVRGSQKIKRVWAALAAPAVHQGPADSYRRNNHQRMTNDLSVHPLPSSLF